MHVHVSCPEGEAKFWLDPIVAHCESYGIPARTLRKIQTVIEERNHEIVRAWKKHFKR
jgi:hypothetical protein